MSEDIVLYKVKDKYAEIIIDRPPVHAWSVTLMQQFYDKLILADNDIKVKCILIKSTGTRLFSAGIDIKIQPEDPEQYYLDRKRLGRLIPEKMMLMKKPIICMVQGSAIGYGMIVIMASDLKIFADRPFPEMFFKMPEIELDMYPSSSATTGPLYAFGLSYAKNILLTSDRFGLEELKNMNFPTRIFPLQTIESDTEEFMNDFVKHKESIMYLIKSTLTLMHNKNVSSWLDMELENSKKVRFEEGLPKTSKEWDDYIEYLYKKYP